MRWRRRDRAREQVRAETETRAALDVAAQHAAASRAAQEAAAAEPADVVMAEVVALEPPVHHGEQVANTGEIDSDAPDAAPVTTATASLDSTVDTDTTVDITIGAEGVPAAVAEPAPVALVSPEAEMHAELVRVLGAVTAMCDHVIDYIESDRAERRAMLEAITRLTRVIESAPATRYGAGDPGERLVGGSVAAGSAPASSHGSNEDEYVIDLAAEERAERETMVEVRGRFGDRWVDGFEICETVHDGRAVRYRLRRILDGAVLPELFDAADIRHVETFDELTSTPQQQRYWSPL